MSDSIPVSLCVLPDPENMGIAVEISLLSCIKAEINVLSFLHPVNCRHLLHTRMSDSIPASLPVLLDLENMGIAAEMSLLSCIETENMLCHFYFRLMAAIFDFRLIQTSDSLSTSPSVLPAFENMA